MRVWFMFRWKHTRKRVRCHPSGGVGGAGVGVFVEVETGRFGCV
jgi:hypothetical protein